MSKNLVIVESPAKARTIEQYLGKDFEVKSSFGHIRDLPKKGLSVDKENGFAPTYEIPADKKKVVAELKKSAKLADTVWLASDEDREGEAIAWHLCQALGLDSKKAKRIVFHEITKPAILHAVENPRTVDEHLVDAQQARRVLDRLVGYELSPVLWKKVRPGLSAGRVQSVAVRLIVEREREIRDHQSASSFRVTAEFITSTKELLPGELSKKIDTFNSASDLLPKLSKDDFVIQSIETKPGVKNSGPPFTTSTLQQEASRRLGFSVRQTMTIAQRLYESGHITYMRTDSTNISPLALDAAAQYIKKEYGEVYNNRQQYQTKNKSAQEAHEGIRPTDVTKTTHIEDEGQAKLYKLIWQRFLASQMSSAKIDKTEIVLKGSETKAEFLAKGEVLLFDGYLKVAGGSKEDVILPKLSVGAKIDLSSLTASEVFTKPSARYSEAALVKKLEEIGIGRPSTYAPTISTIQTRGYVEKTDLEGTERKARILTIAKGKELTTEEKTETVGADRAKLLPTALAEMATDFLVKHFAQIVDYDFTAKAETEFDDIAEGKVQWNKMIADFYNKDFHPLIEKSASVKRSETSQQRLLGNDPETGKPIFTRFGRFGPMLQLGETESEDKPLFATMPTGTTMDNVTFDQAIEMFKLPRMVGATKEGEVIYANIGRFGPYIKIGSLFVSIKPHDPLTIDEKTALELYAVKQKSEAEKNIQIFGDVKVLNGRFGPYVTDGKKNAKIPKDTDPKKITEAEAKKLLKDAPAKGKGRRFSKKPAK